MENQRFEKLRRAPAYKALADAIAREILEGRMKHGDLLPTEAGLVEQFGASRSTVREGIRLLEETGLLRRENGKRLLVSKPSSQEVGNHLERAIILNQVSFREVWEAAMVIEPAMAGAACRNITGDDLAALADNVRRTELAVKAGESLLHLDIEFHSLISNAAHNRALLLVREPFTRIFYPPFESVLTRVPRAGQRLLTAHRRLLDAFLARDQAVVQQWMVKHIEDFKRGWTAAGRSMDEPVTTGGGVLAKD